jgi:hypothetical protein
MTRACDFVTFWRTVSRPDGFFGSHKRRTSTVPEAVERDREGRSVESAAGALMRERSRTPAFLLLDKVKLPASFAGDVSPEEAESMADSQVPWGVNALGGTISEAAWRAKPSWVPADDRG